MVNRRSTFLVGALLTLIVLGCRSCETIDSSKLDPSEIYQEYSITVSENTNVTAGFRVSGQTGTTIALVAPSHVEYNGTPMNEHLRTVLGGTFYSAEDNGFVGSHTFVFTDSTGKRFTNSVDFEPITIAAANLDLDKGAKSINIPLSRGLATGESVTVQIVSDAEPTKPPANAANSNAEAVDGPDYSTDIIGSVDSEAKTLTIGTERLGNFAAGPAKMHITLNGSRNLAEVGIRGGNISYSIKTPSIPVKVIGQH